MKVEGKESSHVQDLEDLPGYNEWRDSQPSQHTCPKCLASLDQPFCPYCLLEEEVLG